jgi:hypothetical protein
MFNIKAFFITTLFARSLTCDRWHFTHMWKTFAWPDHFNKRESLAHEASLTPPHFIEVPVPGKDGERLYICVLGISILSFLRNFYWILELLCGIFLFFFFFFFFFFRVITISWSWSYGIWIYNYLWNQCLVPLTLWVRTPFMARCTWYNIM